MLSPAMKMSRPAVQMRARNLLASVSATLLVATMIAFHAVLLWQRVVDLSLFRPVPAIRWLATVALLVGLYRLHRRGMSLIKGRGALVFWLLVLLLHVCFQIPLAAPMESFDGLKGSAGLLLALPAISIILGLVFPAIRRILARALRGVGLGDLPLIAPLGGNQTYIVRAGLLPTLSCRPPPVCLQQ